MYVRFLREDYDAAKGILTLNAIPLPADYSAEFGLDPGAVSEDIGDTRSPVGILNFATSRHPFPGLQAVRLIAGRQVLSLAVPRASLLGTASRSQPELLKVRRSTHLRTAPMLRPDTRGPILPAGSTLSVVSRIGSSWYRVHSRTGQSGYVLAHPFYVAAGPRTAEDFGETAESGVFCETEQDRAAVGRAMARAAEELLGAPHIWGHDGTPERPGFDAATLVAHVCRKVLGCPLPPVCRLLATVGKPIPRESMEPGDLIVLNNGAHAGICAGEDRMIQAGGGLGIVGHLSVAAGSYWGAQITSVRRLF